MSVPFCKSCVHMYERDISTQEGLDQYRKEAAAHVMGMANEPPYYCCGHPVAREMNRYVACYEMRNLGAACAPEGLLYEGREQ